MAPTSVKSLDTPSLSKTDLFATASRSATTIAELVQVIPQTWRAVLGEHLSSTYKLAVKLSNAQNALAQFERHVTEDTIPANIKSAVKVPSVQYSKEYLATEEGRLADGSIATIIKSARKELFTAIGKHKEAEITALIQATAFNPAKWRASVLDVSNRVANILGCEAKGDTKSASPPTWTKDVNTVLKQECDALWLAGSTLHYRAIALARSIADKSLVEKVKSLTLKAKTDTSMKMDIDTEKSTREIIREELAQALKNKDTKPKPKTSKKSPTPKKKSKGGVKKPSQKKKAPPKKGTKKGKK